MSAPQHTRSAPSEPSDRVSPPSTGPTTSRGKAEIRAREAVRCHAGRFRAPEAPAPVHTLLRLGPPTSACPPCAPPSCCLSQSSGGRVHRLLSCGDTRGKCQQSHDHPEVPSRPGSRLLEPRGRDGEAGSPRPRRWPCTGGLGGCPGGDKSRRVAICDVTGYRWCQ